MPLSLAVAFAMIASFLLSSSLVPVLSTWIMKEKREEEEKAGLFGKLHTRVHPIPERHTASSDGRSRSPILRFRFFSSGSLCRAWEPKSFPDVKAPLLQIRLRAPTGTRIEQTEPLVLKAIDVIKQTVGPEQGC